MMLVNTWKVYIDKEKDKYVIVPAGSETNFATVPWMFRWLLSTTDPALVLPAIVHDYLTRELDRGMAKPVIYSEFQGGRVVDHRVDWWEAAKVFKDMIKFYKGSSAKVKANLAYFGVWVNGHIRRIKKGL